MAAHPDDATAGSRRPILAAATVVILGVVALGVVVVLRRDISENPATTVVESSVPSTAPVATTAPPTSVAEAGGLPMTDKTYTTKSGKTLTDADIEQLADEAATADQTTTSDVIREALRRFLDVA